ncbi:MAG: CHAT domain-containing protein [Alphaproteobacteria bacterium]|nr:CHAT domain-containing protein [Alphaproteobacteria bacterium]
MTDALRSCFCLVPLLLWLGACAETDSHGARPLSIEEARKLALELNRQTTMPPRSIDDVVEAVERARSENRTILYSILADRPVPGHLSGSALADFLIERGEAAHQLGRARQVTADAQRALRLAEGEQQIGSALFLLRVNASLTGNFDDTLEYGEQISRRLGGGWALIALAANAYNLANAGDSERARQLLSRAEALLGELRFADGGRIYAQFGTAYEMSLSLGRAGIAESSGRYDEAEIQYRRAIVFGAERAQRQRSLQQPDLFYQVGLSGLLIKMGRLGESEALARQSLSGFLELMGGESYGTGFALTAVGRALAAQGRLDEAERVTLLAIDILRAIGVAPAGYRMMQAKEVLAGVLAGQGRWREVAALFDEITRDFSRDPELRRSFANTSSDRITALIRTGELRRANEELRELLRLRERVLGPNHYETAEARALLGVALQQQGELAPALAELERAIPPLFAASRLTEEAETNFASARRRRLAAEAYIGLLMREGRTEEAFRWAEAARGLLLQRAVGQAAARAAARSPALAELVRQEQDLLRATRARYQSLANLANEVEYSGVAAAAAATRVEIDRLREARTALRREIETRFPDYASFINPTPTGTAELRAALRPGEVVIAFMLGEERSFVWAVRDGAVSGAEIAASAGDIAARIHRLREAVDSRARLLGEIPPYDVAAAHDLFRLLLEPVRRIWQDAKVLIVIPDGALGQLPLALLPTAPATALPRAGQALFAEYAVVPWLVRTHAIVQVPSAAMLKALRSLPERPATHQSFAGFGDPYFSLAQAAEAGQAPSVSREMTLAARGLPLVRRNPPGTIGRRSATLGDLPRLPDTADELKAIAGLLGANVTEDVFLGSRASEARVKKLDLTGRRIIAFATHGLVPGELDGLIEPALALSAPALEGNSEEDGLLTMSEIFGLRLDADWVILSACNTGSPDGRSSDAVSGLGRAFFYAGSRALLVTNWPVQSASARDLTVGVFAAQKQKGSSRPEALRHSILALIDGDGQTDPQGRTLFSYAHPLFWAPFSLVGN